MSKPVDVSHQITDGMITSPNLPEPSITESSTAPGTAGHGNGGGRVAMAGATGTYVEMPAHRYRDGADLADLDLDRVADLPGAVVDVADARQIGPEAFSGLELRGRAVLLRTGWDRHWRTEAYGGFDHPHLTEAAAKTLVEAGAVLVGIDSVGVDDTAPATEGARPALAVLLAAGIPVVSHLCLLDELPNEGFRFFAVPAKVRGLAAFPVRAFALVG
ncbi:cyclase family protein [Nocardiopsis lambiniae]|uniref:Cyclase family protein n=1 Tax=Nocardiopsis lambiniae TaxID=3075539 RepID=A0ABU2M9G3_9ACTN|nr:cyclase family protein [Nocardiopsis sp. DSM 44743]MDT0329313.1 cyclase family protein [Nocardiopsis sp. DSM 44743]